MTVFTIGHSTRSADEFVALLQEAGADYVVDVRRSPFSRRYPHFNGEALAATLGAVGIGYRHEPALGGRRGRRRDGAPSPHTLWREEAFANYADYAETQEFRDALGGVLRLARDHRPAVMCAEAVWWRCHRRIIADYLIAAGLPVEHILAPGKIEPARLTTDATIRPDGSVLYRAPTLL
ncbi:MAG TPA: DUF488 domain-containing protein [Stellaceae bacterium]|nr:DUF488 domain-containing protein [Stellaceae bacterium]